jgi:hypothetical protein
LEQILRQPYTYLTKGKQSFVFLSEDKKWVIKFFRLPRHLRRLSLKSPSERSPLFFQTLNNSKGAYEDLSEETGVLYSHLSPCDSVGVHIHLIDKFKQAYFLPLDELPFVVQKYGEDFFSALDKSPHPEKLLEQTVQLFTTLYNKGYIDRDPIFEKNFGVVDHAPFIIDIGQVEKASELPPKEEYLAEMTHSLHVKLQRESPKLYAYFKKLLH